MFPPGPGFTPTSSSADSPLGSASTRLSFEDKEKYSTLINSGPSSSICYLPRFLADDPPRTGSHLGKEEQERDDATASTLSTLQAGLPFPRLEQAPPPWRRRRLVLALLLTGPILLALAVGIPVGLASMKARQLTAAGPNKQTNGNSPQPMNPPHPVGPITGGDGSLVTMEDGSTFTYSNKFGGFCKFSRVVVQAFIIGG
jgi:hypothetical protein